MKKELYVAVIALLAAVCLSGCRGLPSGSVTVSTKGTDEAGGNQVSAEENAGEPAATDDSVETPGAADTSAGAASLPEISADEGLLSPSRQQFDMEYGADGDVIFFADIDHDGTTERISAGLADYSSHYSSVLSVHAQAEADSPVLWERDYGTAHAGWIMLYLCRENGKDYLMEYAPVMYQGAATYRLTLFSLDGQGNQVVLREYKTDFQLSQAGVDGRSGFYGNPEETAEFLDTADALIAGSLLLVSTDEGRLAYSTPERPLTAFHDVSSITSVWDVTGR